MSDKTTKLRNRTKTDNQELYSIKKKLGRQITVLSHLEALCRAVESTDLALVVKPSFQRGINQEYYVKEARPILLFNFLFILAHKTCSTKSTPSHINDP